MASPLDVITQIFAAVSTAGLSLVTDLPDAAKSWLSSAGGEIGSGIEGGFIALIRDLWNVIVGPVEIFVGVVLIVFAVALAFKNDLLQAGRMFGMAGI